MFISYHIILLSYHNISILNFDLDIYYNKHSLINGDTAIHIADAMLPTLSRVAVLNKVYA